MIIETKILVEQFLGYDDEFDIQEAILMELSDSDDIDSEINDKTTSDYKECLIDFKNGVVIIDGVEEGTVYIEWLQVGQKMTLQDDFYRVTELFKKDRYKE